MGAPAASRLRVAALLALRPALRPVRFDAHVLGPGCAAFGLAGSALQPTPRRFRAAGPAPAPLEGSLWVAFAAPALSLRSRRRAPANGSGDVAVSPDARLPPRVGAATLESSSGSLSRSPRLCRDSDTLRPAAGMPGSTLYVQSRLCRAAERRWQGNRSRDCPCAACDTIACGDASPPGQHLPFRRYSHGRKHHQRNVQRVASGNRNHRPSAGEEGVSGERGFWHKRSRGPLQSNPALN